MDRSIKKKAREIKDQEIEGRCGWGVKGGGSDGEGRVSKESHSKEAVMVGEVSGVLPPPQQVSLPRRYNSVTHSYLYMLQKLRTRPTRQKVCTYANKARRCVLVCVWVHVLCVPGELS